MMRIVRLVVGLLAGALCGEAAGVERVNVVIMLGEVALTKDLVPSGH